MACKTDNFKFDPDKTALENLFALIYRTNRVRLDPKIVDVEVPRPHEGDPDGDNTVITVKAKADGPMKGQVELYYARADINTHYPDFSIDAMDLAEIPDKEALIRYLDDNFNLVDGEFDVTMEGSIWDLLFQNDIDLYAKEQSYIYIGHKSITILWTVIRRATEEGLIRVTEDGQFRVLDDLPALPA
jgi:hypothetical protein